MSELSSLIALIIAFSVVIFILWVSFISFRMTKKENQEFERFIAANGLKETPLTAGASTPGGIVNEVKVWKGKSRGVQVTVKKIIILLGNIAATHQRKIEIVIAGKPSSIDNKLLVAKPWMLNFIHDVPADAAKIASGNEAFDKTFTLFADNPSAISIIGSDVQKKMLDIPNIRELRISGGEVSSNLAITASLQELESALGLVSQLCAKTNQ